MQKAIGMLAVGLTDTFSVQKESWNVALRFLATRNVWLLDNRGNVYIASYKDYRVACVVWLIL